MGKPSYDVFIDDKNLEFKSWYTDFEKNLKKTFKRLFNNELIKIKIMIK